MKIKFTFWFVIIYLALLMVVMAASHTLELVMLALLVLLYLVSIIMKRTTIKVLQMVMIAFILNVFTDYYGQRDLYASSIVTVFYLLAFYDIILVKKEFKPSDLGLPD